MRKLEFNHHKYLNNAFHQTKFDTIYFGLDIKHLSDFLDKRALLL